MANSKQKVAVALTRDGIIGNDIPLDPHEGLLLDAATALFEEGAELETVVALATLASQSGRHELDDVLADLRSGTPEADVVRKQELRQAELTKLYAAIRHVHVIRAFKTQQDS